MDVTQGSLFFQDTDRFRALGLGETVKEKLARQGIAKFFVSESGFCFVPDTHIRTVIDHPASFGVERAEIERLYRHHHEPIGFEGKAREDILRRLFKGGWVRVRIQGGGRPALEEAIVFNLDDYTKRYDLVDSFLQYCREEGFITQDTKVHVIETEESDLAVGHEHPIIENIFVQYDAARQNSPFAGIFSRDRAPVLLWYPSSDFDTKPLAHLHPGNCERFGLPVPDLFVFNTLGSQLWDELRDAYLAGRGLRGRRLFEDSFTTISVSSFIPLELAPEVVPWRRGPYYSYPRDFDDRSMPFEAALMRVLVDSDRYGPYVQNLLFVELENSVFVHDIIREHYLEPTYYWSTRDGCGFGGNGRCENNTALVDLYIERRDMRPSYWITDHVSRDDLRRTFWADEDGDEYRLTAERVGLRHAHVEEMPFSMAKAFKLSYDERESP